MKSSGNPFAAATLADVFLNAVESNSERLMLYEEAGKWKSISSRELYRRVSGVARGLLACGVNRGDRVAILGENRPEWAIADFAALMIGAVTVPIYATLTSGQCEYILQHAEAKVIFVSTAAQVEKILRISARTHLERIIAMDRVPRSDQEVSWMGDLYKDGLVERDREFDSMAEQITPLMLATLIYTSGTTGVPKGVMITHGNLASNISVSLESFKIKPGMTSISFLPLAHIVARHVDIGLLNRGCTLAYCPVIDDLARVMREIRPTLFVAVPRVYEKMYNRASSQASQGIKGSLFNWAIKVGGKHIPEILAGKRPKALQLEGSRKTRFLENSRGDGRTGSDFRCRAARPWAANSASGTPRSVSRYLKAMASRKPLPWSRSTPPATTGSGVLGVHCPTWKCAPPTTAKFSSADRACSRSYWRMPEETHELF